MTLKFTARGCKSFLKFGGKIKKNFCLFYLQTEPALIYDSVYVFAAGLQAFDGNQLSSSSPSSSNVSCESEIPWNEGLSLINYINSVNNNNN